MIASEMGHTEIVEKLKAHKKKARKEARKEARKKARKKARTCTHCNTTFVEKLPKCELCKRRCCRDCHWDHLLVSCPCATGEIRAAVRRRLGLYGAENID